MSNISVTISAETADLEAKFAVAKARANELTSELNKLARQAASSGDFAAMKSQLDAAATSMLEAKAKAADLRSELGEGHTAFSGFSDAAGIAREALSAFGLAASVGGIVEFGKSLSDNAAEMAHAAEVVGLSVTDYQAFTESAKIAGVQVDVVEASIKRFNTAQGDALAGLKLQAEAFRDLGVDASLPANEALPAIARALLATSDAAERARIETVLFGRSGQELNPALREWAQGADTLAQRNIDLGVALDPGVAEAAKKAETQLGIINDRLSSQLTPTFVAVKSLIADVIDGLESFGDIKLPDWLLGPGVEGKGLLSGSGASGPAVPFSAPFAGPDTLGLSGVNDKEKDDYSSHLGLLLEMRRQNDALIIQDIENTAREIEQQYRNEQELAASAITAEMAARRQNDALTIQGIENTAHEIEEQARREEELRKSAMDAELAARRQTEELQIQEIEKSGQEFERIQHQEVEARRSAMNEIKGIESQLVSGIISGRENASQIATRLIESVLEKELSADLEYLTAHILFNDQELASDQAKYAEGWATQRLFQLLGIQADAGKAAAGAMAATADIPVIGPFLAPATAAGIFSEVLGFASFDVGTPYVPRDMIAQIHQGERIIPASQNRGGGEYAGGREVNFHYNPIINEAGGNIDLSAHAREIASIFKGLARDGYV